MNHDGKKPIAIVESQCSFIISPLMNALEQAGLWVLRSFEFKNNQTQLMHCHCAANCDSQCECELVVLLVYPKVGNPVTLILDGREGKTYVFISEEKEYQFPTPLTRLITKAVEESAMSY